MKMRLDPGVTALVAGMMIMLACCAADNRLNDSSCPEKGRSQIPVLTDQISASRSNLVGVFENRNGAEEIQWVVDSLGTGHRYSVDFSASKSNGLGAAPDGEGVGRVGSDGKMHFDFEDSFGNKGSGEFSSSGDSFELRLEAHEVAEPRCLVFYHSYRLVRSK